MKSLPLAQCAAIAAEIAGGSRLWRYFDDGKWSRTGPELAARAVFVWLARNRTAHSMPEIADFANDHLGRRGEGHSFCVVFTQAVTTGRQFREWKVNRNGGIHALRWTALEAEAVALADRQGTELATVLPPPIVPRAPGRTAGMRKPKRQKWTEADMAAAGSYGR